MYVQLNCAIVDPDANNRQELTSFLGQFGVNVIAQAPTADLLTPLLGRQDAPQLVIINLDPNPPETLRKVGTLPRQFGGVSFFVMSATMDANLLMEAMHLGVREFIPLPIPEAKFAAGGGARGTGSRDGQTGAGHQLRAHDRWMRIDHRCLQCRGVTGKNRQDLPGRSGLDARRSCELFRC